MATRLVLDATAITAYARGSVDVGELITEVAEEGARIAVPVTCLAEAAAPIVDPTEYASLEVLAGHPAVDLIDTDPALWRQLAAATAVLGSLGRAVAALTVTEGLAEYVVTAEPDAYHRVVDTIAI